jgi:sorting nexin-1/2
VSCLDRTFAFTGLLLGLIRINAQNTLPHTLSVNCCHHFFLVEKNCHITHPRSKQIYPPLPPLFFLYYNNIYILKKNLLKKMLGASRLVPSNPQAAMSRRARPEDAANHITVSIYCCWNILLLEMDCNMYETFLVLLFCCVVLCCVVYPLPSNFPLPLLQVSDPVQHSEGVNKYTSYRVDVRSPIISNNNNNNDLTAPPAFSAVLRRYSDFLWLYEKLQTERPGAIVPPLPEKQPMGRFNPAFVEARRRELERFLRRLAIHPELQDSVSLETFLRADDMTFLAAKNSKGTDGLVMMYQQHQHQHQHQPPMSYQQQQQQQYQQQPGIMPGMMGGSIMSGAGGAMPSSPYGAASGFGPGMMGGPRPKKEGFKRWFAETKTSISGDLVKSPDDELFDEIQRYIHGLDCQMKNVSTQATGLVRKGKEMANGLFEFGLAFNLLGQSEADALGEALCKLGETADQLSVLSAEHSDQEAVQFEDPLVDMIKMIHAVKLALHKRHEKRLTYSTCLQEVESKTAQLAKMRAQIGMESKAYAMEMSLRRAQEHADIARDDFASVSQRVLREVDRFKRETTDDMRTTVLEYIRLQVAYNKRMEQIWANLIPQLERVQLDPNANVVGDPGSGNATGPSPNPSTTPGPENRGQGMGGVSSNVPLPGQPQIHSQPVIINNMPNPQQPYMHQSTPPNPFLSQSMQAGTTLPPQPQQPPHQNPGMLSVQYREGPSGGF